jgi:hypothetical protein
MQIIRPIGSSKDGAVTSGKTIAESRHARHANSDLTHLLMADERVFHARWPSAVATVTPGSSTTWLIG